MIPIFLRSGRRFAPFVVKASRLSRTMASAMTKPKVLLLGEIQHQPSRDAWNSLSSIAELVTAESTSRIRFIKECKSGNLDGVVAAYRTFGSASITGNIDDELLSALPKSFKFFCHNGAGYDQFDIAACTRHGVLVSNVPDLADDATADTNMFLILGALRNFSTSMQAIRQLNWRGVTPPDLGTDPQGKVLGILGMGGIGRNVKRKAEVFGMKVQYHNRRRLPADKEDGAKYVSFDELLATSDVISLNLPLNKNTYHIIGNAEIQKMKKDVVIVNTARGSVIDEGALADALSSRRVRCAGLDVYEDEPNVHPGLIANPNCILLPHMGTWSVETQTKMELLTVANVRSAIEHGILKTKVVEQKDVTF